MLKNGKSGKRKDESNGRRGKRESFIVFASVKQRRRAAKEEEQHHTADEYSDLNRLIAFIRSWRQILLSLFRV